MKRLRFSNLRFASKIFFLMGLMGFLAACITGYALINMRAIDQQYHDLIEHDGRGAMAIADAARHLDSASRLAYEVLTEQDEVRMLALLKELSAIKSQYDSELGKLEQVLPTQAAQANAITAESQRVFETAERIITTASRWRGDQSLQILHREFEPALQDLQSHMDTVRSAAISQFTVASVELNRRTAQTILFTALAIAIALLVVIPLSLYVAITQMSRPIAQLTRTMERMSQRRYDDAIVWTGRRDEVGRMANALRVFQGSMQREDRLVVELAAGEEARKLSEQLVDLIDAIPGAVFQIQVSPLGSRRILFASDRATQLLGRPLAELQQYEEPAGQEFVSASQEEIQHAHDAFLHCVRTLAPLNLDTATTQAGQIRWIKTLATARRTAGGGAIFNGVWLDVTEQKEQAQALVQAKNIAEKVADDKARFLATMSHEIRTPLNAMLGMTQLAIHHESELPQRDRIEKAMGAGRRLLNIVNDVLDISKIEAGKMVIDPEDFAPHEWLVEIRDLLLGELQAKGLDLLLLHVAPNTPERVRGDQQRMSQILINYLNNAIKFTHAGAITVSIDTLEVSPQGTLLICQVQDTGIGISAIDQAGLFTAFGQGDASITRRFGGTGLGLTISRRLAELMGGEAGVSSTLGKGSTFWFTARIGAPASPAPLVAYTDLGGEIAQVPTAVRLPYRGTQLGRSARVLLVDDNELNRAVAHGMLEVGGITVDEAGDGAQALAMLEGAESGTYALVLMDMQMPVMDGLTAARALRQNPRFALVPVIALTANASEDDIARTRAAGMNDHLSKPLLEEALWRCMLRWLPSHPSGAEPPAAELDAAVLQDLRDAFGIAHADALASAFLHDCEIRLARMQATADSTYPFEWGPLTKDAHDLSGYAGSFGLTRLGDLAHGLRALLDQRDEANTRVAIRQLLECARVDLAALRIHRQEHAPTDEVGVRA